MIKQFIERAKRANTSEQHFASIIAIQNGCFIPMVAFSSKYLIKNYTDSHAIPENSLRYISSQGDGFIDIGVDSNNGVALLKLSILGVELVAACEFARFFYNAFLLPDIYISGIDGLPGKKYCRAELEQLAFGNKVGHETILTAGPSISDLEISYGADAIMHGWNSQWNKYLKRFEDAFAQYVGARYAIATSSCTGALHIALTTLGIGPGDEVIVPDITWVATANAVLYVGATPVFADVDAATWCIDPLSVKSLITPKTKAIIPVHLYGHPCNMDAIMQLAEQHSLFVVEDAAPSIGAEYKGRRTGSFGHFAAFSFQGAKLAVTGEGGMLVTSDEALFKRAYAIWDQGRTPGSFWIETNGLKYKMSNVQAAIGLGQLQRIDGMIAAKRRIFSWYQMNLKGVSGIRLYSEAAWAKSICWMTSILVTEGAQVGRDEMIRQLKSRNVDSRPVFPAISQYPIWPVRQEPKPEAKYVGDRGINLPSGVCLSKAEVDYVCRQVIGILK